MLYPDVKSKEISVFQGAVVRLDVYSIPPGNALLAQNAGYVRGQATTSFGHTLVVIQADGAIPSAVNWYFTFGVTPVSVLAYYTPGIGVRTMQLANFVTATAMAQAGAAGACLVPAGQRLYAAFYDATGRQGIAAGRVYGWNVGDDVLFAAPTQNLPTVTEPGAGVVNAGVGRVGFLMTTRNGYTTRLNPVNSQNVFSPVTYTSSGGKNLQVSIPGGLPSYMTGGSIQLVMTTKANLNKFFTVPGAVTSPPGSPTIFTVNITDNDLAATGTDVTAYQNLLATSQSGTPPILPNSIGTYSSRMLYTGLDGVGVPVIYVSEPDKYQYVTADQHAIYLEGQALPVSALSLRGVCYIGTNHSMYSTEDNGGVPGTWSKPQKVDGSIGWLAPDCVCVNPAQGYAWIASDRGLYLFQGGMFPPLPVSYYQQADWNRINWNMPTTVKPVDDQLNKRVMVKAPLNIQVVSASNTNPITITTGLPPAAGQTPVVAKHQYESGITVTISGVIGNAAANTTAVITVTGPNTFTIPVAGTGAYAGGGLVAPAEATHELTWDYTESDQPEGVKYSLKKMPYRLGASLIVQNNNTFLNEVWYTPNIAGAIIRQADGSEMQPYRNVTTAGVPAPIEAIYQTALIPGASNIDSFGAIGSTIHDYHGMHARIFGNGPVTITAIGLDGVRSVSPAQSPLILQLNPGKEYLIKWWLRSEQQSIQFMSNTLDGFFVLSYIRASYTDGPPQR